MTKREKVNEFRKTMSVEKACKKAGISTAMYYYKPKTGKQVVAQQTKPTVLSVLKMVRSLDVTPIVKEQLTDILLTNT